MNKGKIYSVEGSLAGIKEARSEQYVGPDIFHIYVRLNDSTIKLITIPKGRVRFNFTDNYNVVIYSLWGYDSLTDFINTNHTNPSMIPQWLDSIECNISVADFRKLQTTGEVIVC